MSNVNDYDFAKKLDVFKTKILDPHIKKTDEAEKIMHDTNYQWASPEQKEIADKKYDSLKAWKVFYQEFYNSGLALSVQHEKLVNKLCKLYERWYNEVSNDGFQEKELMSMQADVLNDIFSEIFMEIKSLEGMNFNPPRAINLK